MTDYTWVDDAPVIVLNPDEVDGRARRLVEISNAWGGASSTRHGETDDIAGLIERKGVEKGANFEYRVAGEPLALMTLNLEADGPVEIKFLVTHPGTQNAGGIMVEYALNLVARLIKEHDFPLVPGALQLESHNENATAAYQALGFFIERAGSYPRMVLDADESDKWEQVAEKWRLKKYKTLRYLATT